MPRRRKLSKGCGGCAPADSAGWKHHHVEERWHHRGIRSWRVSRVGDGGARGGASPPPPGWTRGGGVGREGARSSTAAGWNSWARAWGSLRTTAKARGSRSTRAVELVERVRPVCRLVHGEHVSAPESGRYHMVVFSVPLNAVATSASQWTS